MASLAVVLRDLTNPRTHIVSGLTQRTIGRLALVTRESVNANLKKMAWRNVVKVGTLKSIRILDEEHLAHITQTGVFQLIHPR